MSSFPKEYGAEPTSALHLFFSKSSESTFKILNEAWHSRLPKVGNSHFRVCFKAEYHNVIYAVASWSNPVARLLPQRTWLELRRFAIAEDAPRFTASRMPGWMRREIPKFLPEVEKAHFLSRPFVSRRTIYKASGWKQAEGYKPRARGWTGWGNRPRKGRTNQSVAPRMRWETGI